LYSLFYIGCRSSQLTKYFSFTLINVRKKKLSISLTTNVKSCLIQRSPLCPHFFWVVSLCCHKSWRSSVQLSRAFKFSLVVAVVPTYCYILLRNSDISLNCRIFISDINTYTTLVGDIYVKCPIQKVFVGFMTILVWF